jgi:hypothetical protein
MPETEKPRPAAKTRVRTADKPAARPRIQIRPAVKEFDIRTAHREWKERNGLDIDDSW